MDTQEKQNPNEGGEALDPQRNDIPEEQMEIVTPTPSTSAGQKAQDQEASCHSSSDAESATTSEEVTKSIGDLTLKRWRLAGASKKRLSKLLKGGITYESALKQILEERTEKRKETESGQSSSAKVAERPKEPESGQTSSAPASAKRHRSDNSTPDQCAKKARKSGHAAVQSYREAAEGVKVGLTHTAHPTSTLNGEQLVQLQRAVISAVRALPDDGPQVRFFACKHRPGWLQLTCADETSVEWLKSAATNLQPWEGASLKLVQGEELPRTQVCVAYIPDDEPGNRLSSEVVTQTLRKMNHGLLTQEWVVLHHVESGPGQTWTFSIDEVSMAELERLNFRPFFGFGRVQFRHKNKIIGSGQETKAPEPAKEGGVAPAPKLTGKGGKSQGKGAKKWVPRKKPATQRPEEIRTEPIPGPSDQGRPTAGQKTTAKTKGHKAPKVHTATKGDPKESKSSASGKTADPQSRRLQ